MTARFERAGKAGVEGAGPARPPRTRAPIHPKELVRRVREVLSTPPARAVASRA